ncbi:MAG: hypothetical protein KBA61_03135 [Spirochaetes bacterium]|nr:hypothetical protein [Spirochaetota bacterium]
MGFLSGIEIALRFAVLNIAFSVYALIVPPLVLPFLRDTTSRAYTGSNWIIGTMILVALAVEAPALYYRMQVIGQMILARQPKRAGSRIEIPWLFLLVILHAALGVMVTIFAVRSFGFRFRSDEWISNIMFLAALAREGWIIYLLFSRRVPEVAVPIDRLKSILADAGIFLFCCVAFTATWQVIPPAVNREATLASSLLLFFFSVILFLMFYLPCNIAYLVEDLLLLRGKKEIFLRAAALAVAVISAVGPMSFHGMLNARADREELRLRQEKDAALQQRIMEERRLMEERMR